MSRAATQASPRVIQVTATPISRPFLATSELCPRFTGSPGWRSGFRSDRRSTQPSNPGRVLKSSSELPLPMPGSQQAGRMLSSALS